MTDPPAINEFSPTLPVGDGPDGRAYVDAVAAASDRSRTIIYFILILMVLTFTSIRNNYYPDWMSARSGAHQDLHRCLLANDLGHRDCKAMSERLARTGYTITGTAKDLGFELTGTPGDENFVEANKYAISRLQFKIDAFEKKDIDLYTITIPLLGSFVDINDIWLISGVVMLFLLYLLRANLDQEYRNILYIFNNKQSYADLVGMTQVLSVMTLDSNLLTRIVHGLVWMMPTILYVYLLALDLNSYKIGLIYLPTSLTIGAILPEVITVILVGIFNVLSLLSHLRVRELLRAQWRPVRWRRDR